MALMRDKLISNEKEDFGALNRPQFSFLFQHWEIHVIGCPAIQMLHLVGTNSRRNFCWPLDSDRQIFVLPQDSLLVSTICWPSPSRVWVLLKVFSGIIWLPHIIHNYPSTIKNTTKDHTQDMAKINVWPGCKWYQATWSARLLINFQFFLQFPRRVVALHQLSKVTRAMCRDVKDKHY